MSKYRIDLRPSSLRHWAVLVAATCAVILVVEMREHVLPAQPLWQALLCFVIVQSALACLLPSTSAAHFYLTDRGEWTLAEHQQMQSWTMSPKSYASQWVAFVHLIPSVGVGADVWRWVYRDQVTDADFRRICRAIRYVRYAHTGKQHT